MNHDFSSVDKAPGGRAIEEFCREAGKELGLEFERVYWVAELTEPDEKHTLYIIAKSGSTEITLTRHEIDEFPKGESAKSTKEKLKAELEGIV